eukprot:7387750-Prymnesium_polylepis.1
MMSLMRCRRKAACASSAVYVRTHSAKNAGDGSVSGLLAPLVSSREPRSRASCESRLAMTFSGGVASSPHRVCLSAIVLSCASVGTSASMTLAGS